MSRMLGKKAREFLEREDVRSVLKRIDNDSGRIGATRGRPRENNDARTTRGSESGARRSST